MKSVRFAKVVAKCGRPEVHLTLIAPAKDRAFQSALKENRVMTVLQESVGTKTDRGEIGFEAGPARQFLIFPKSLRAFAGRTVVGIKYDLLSSRKLPKSQRATPPRTPKQRNPNTSRKVEREKPERVASAKVIAFQPPPANGRDDEESDGVAELKTQVRQAMAKLEDGKPVAAFNLLKRIVGD